MSKGSALERKLSVFVCILFVGSLFAQTGVVIDHTCTNITQIPQSAIEQAKSTLHIAYGHTSHGSQLTTGMNGLIDFANNGGRGLSLPRDIFEWNNGGSNGVLDLHDYAMGGDVGYYPQWVNNTRNYLDDPSNADVNVILWSWCGQASSRTEATMISTYLEPMAQLEADYPNVIFVYMTGHLDGSGETGNLNLRNQQIRDFCQANDKILYDFADIESYDPDGQINYMPLDCNDGCSYDSNNDGSRDRNWATEWQDSHTQNVDWYSCSSAHSQPLNANQKAYAAWWLWARVAGWSGPSQDNSAPSVPQNLVANVISQTQIDLSWNASIDAESGISRYDIYQDNNYIGNTSGLTYQVTGLTASTAYTFEVAALNGAGILSSRSNAVNTTTEADLIDNESPTQPKNLQAHAVSSSEINLMWDSSSDNVGVVGYRVNRDGNQISTTTQTEFHDSGLQSATEYNYTVQAYDAIGNRSQASSIALATTWDPSNEVHTIELIVADTEVRDAFLSESHPTTNYGNTAYVSTIDRFIVQFLLPDEVIDKEIVSADLYLYVWNQTNYQANQYLELYRITAPWSENYVSWNDASLSNTWNQSGGDYDQSTIAAKILHQQGSDNWDHVYYPPADIKSLVQDWVDEVYSNHGILIMNPSQTGIGVKASEYTSGRPYLQIQYKEKSVNPDCPEKPILSKLEVVNGNQIQASWHDITEATGYHVHRSTQAFFKPGSQNRIGSQITDADGSLSGCQWIEPQDVIGDPAQNYFYAVSTLKGSLESPDYCRFGEFDFALQTTQTTSFNHITLPLDMAGVKKASDLQALIPHCNSVAQWNMEAQGYEAYIPGIEATNFEVSPGGSYYVNVTQNGVFTTLGSIPSPQYRLITTQTTNFNEVMLTLDQTDIINAASLLISLPHCNSIAYWDASIQGYQQYIAALPMTNFAVKPGYPYFVNVTGDGTWPTHLLTRSNTNRPIAKVNKRNLKAPHLVWGYLILNPPLTLEYITFEASITSRPDDFLTPEAAGCGFGEDEGRPLWFVQCATFPSGWDKADTLHVDFLNQSQNILGSVEVVLSYNPSDSADTVILNDKTAIDQYPVKINRFQLGENYPNPFNPVTSIPFDLSQSAFVQLDIFDIQGKHIQTLIKENYSAGSHACLWHAENQPSGIYIYQIRMGHYIAREKMLLLK